jgi:hypothetical protein
MARVVACGKKAELAEAWAGELVTSLVAARRPVRLLDMLTFSCLYRESLLVPIQRPRRYKSAKSDNKPRAGVLALL